MAIENHPDPVTNDIWFLPLMSSEWHLWIQNHPESVCGLPWSCASYAFDCKMDRPKDNICKICGG